MVHILGFVVDYGCRRHIEKYNIYPDGCQPFIDLPTGLRAGSGTTGELPQECMGFPAWEH